MMSRLTIVALLAALLIVWLIWAARRFMFSFEIRIRGGSARLYAGKPRAGFLAEVQEAVDRNGITRGWVRGVGSGRKTRLSFAGPISPEAQQQLRNAWSLLR